MAKVLEGHITIKALAGQAEPNSALEALLGSVGIGVSEFCRAFNTQSVKEGLGTPLKTKITMYKDYSFSLRFTPAPQT